MDKLDRENLRFLIECSEAQLRAWYSSTSSREHEYAHRLMVEHRNELALKAALLVDEVVNIDEATNLLTKYRL